MKCPHCGVDIAVTTKTCPWCGCDVQTEIYANIQIAIWFVVPLLAWLATIGFLSSKHYTINGYIFLLYPIYQIIWLVFVKWIKNSLREDNENQQEEDNNCLLYTSPSPRDCS